MRGTKEIGLGNIARSATSKVLASIESWFCFGLRIVTAENISDIPSKSSLGLFPNLE